MQILEKCTLCPHECKVNRIKGEIGRCKSDSEIKISLADLHFFEEPCISGKSGSGTVFFTGCNMKCKFCQNYEISQLCQGRKMTVENLANEFLKLEACGANNINLVTGCIYVPQIIETINLAKSKGLKIPIVYNSSGYEKKETIQMLDGYIDIYLPDFKYYYNSLAKELSGIDNYFEIATSAIQEMYRQVGTPQFNESGIIKKGLIVRHLVLPNHLQNTKMVLKWLKRNFGSNIYISIMAQYFPEYKAMETEDINRKLTQEEYEKVQEYISDLKVENGYIQDLEENEKKYVPKWNI